MESQDQTANTPSSTLSLLCPFTKTWGREKAFLYTKLYYGSALEATVSFIFILNSIKIHRSNLD